MATTTVKVAAGDQLEQLERRPLVVFVEEPDDLVADALVWAREFAELVAGVRRHEGRVTRAELVDVALGLVECCEAALAVRRCE